MGKVFVVQQPTRKVRREDIEPKMVGGREIPARYSKELLHTFVPAADLTPALKYGDLELLIDTGVVIGIAVAPLLATLKDKLRNFCDDDYLILTGNPVAMGLATAVAIKQNGRAKILVWDRKESTYYMVQTPEI